MFGSIEERPLLHMMLKLSSKLTLNKYLKNISLKDAK